MDPVALLVALGATDAEVEAIAANHFDSHQSLPEQSGAYLALIRSWLDDERMQGSANPGCPKCGRREYLAHTSTVTVTMPHSFGDDKQHWHVHDANVHRSVRTCPNKHSYVRYSRKRCPAPGCDFNKEEAS